MNAFLSMANNSNLNREAMNITTAMLETQALKALQASNVCSIQMAESNIHDGKLEMRKNEGK